VNDVCTAPTRDTAPPTLCSCDTTFDPRTDYAGHRHGRERKSCSIKCRRERQRWLRRERRQLARMRATEEKLRAAGQMRLRFNQ